MLKLKKILSIALILSILLPLWIQSVTAQESYEFYLPGYFWKSNKNSYDWVDETLLDQLKVSLTFKTEPTSGIMNFGKTSHTSASRASRHEAVKQLSISQTKYANAEMKDIAMQATHNPNVQQIFIEMWGAISLREWETRERNPKNFQWIWQVYALEQLKWWKCHNNTKWRASVYDCATIQHLYQNLRGPLTQEERHMQTVDFFKELLEKFGNVDKTRYNNPKSPYSYYENINIWMKAVLWRKWYSTEDINKLTQAIINEDKNTLLSFLSKERETLATIWMRTPEDFNRLKEYVRWWTIGTIYNGAWNNYNYSQTKRVRNVLNHQYVSNMPNHWFRFVWIRCDGCGIDWNRPDANPWVIPAVLDEFPDKDKRHQEFLALLVYLRNAGELQMAYKGNKL